MIGTVFFAVVTFTPHILTPHFNSNFVIAIIAIIAIQVIKILKILN